MPYTRQYTPESMSRADVDQTEGPLVLEFGTNWCGFCQGAQPHIQAAMDDKPDVRHVKVEDGKGRRLGRTYGVKLWPALIVLQNGQEVGRVVRPEDRNAIDQALGALGTS